MAPNTTKGGGWRELPLPGESGAALVELALSTMLLAVLIAGIVQYGALFGSTIDISEAARDAARTGSQTTTQAVDDKAIIAAILDRPNTPISRIERVVIYRADSANGLPPAFCLDYDNSGPAACNIYLPSDFSAGAASLNLRAFAQGWPVSKRMPGTDFLGVWVQVKTNKFMNLIWSPDRFTDRAVMKLDPAGESLPPTATKNGFSNNTSTNPGTKWGWECYPVACAEGSIPDGGGGGAGGNLTGGGSA